MSALKKIGEQRMSEIGERIRYGDAVPSETFLKVFREKKAAAAISG